MTEMTPITQPSRALPKRKDFGGYPGFDGDSGFCLDPVFDGYPGSGGSAPNLDLASDGEPRHSIFVRDEPCIAFLRVYPQKSSSNPRSSTAFRIL
jgi:hypothetical protein